MQRYVGSFCDRAWARQGLGAHMVDAGVQAEFVANIDGMVGLLACLAQRRANGRRSQTGYPKRSSDRKLTCNLD